MSDPVLFNELPAGAQRFVGHAQLNVENTLNSLSLQMVRLLTPRLADWAVREDIAAVVISAVGERAFCAGGDIQALYHAVVANRSAGQRVDDYPYRFFEEEYRLDYALHRFPKPVVTIGHGVVMGGGLGLFSASSHRVVTETSRLAVPEITIGLFPDAGATWTLGQMPQHWASFLGLTGSHVNASDALRSGMATHVVAQADRETMLGGICALPLGDAATDNHALIDTYLSQTAPPDLPPAELTQLAERQVHVDDLQAEVAEIYALQGRSKWIDRGINNLRNGCPTTAGIVIEQLRRVPDLSLADSFRLELTVATHCADNADFQEGVRALLIDKDNSPAWQFGDMQGLQWSHVLSHFDPPWPQHPLQDLD